MASGSDDGAMDFADIPTRPMRVKILYTFDAESKTTCLARLPSTLNIPAIAIDEQSQVGVIELRQCVQAIVSASPEIMSQLENGDFSVYSYDYSEYDAPVVGQGRMSTLLAASAPSTDDSKTMITGRVCKNIALFNNGVKETLEVKFKLTPLARPPQSASNLDAFRSLSPATSAGFDPNAWNASLQKPQQQSNEFYDFGMPSVGDHAGAASLEELFGMGTGSSGELSNSSQQGGVGVQQTPTDSSFAYNPAFSTQSHSAPGSRAGSPLLASKSSSRSELLRHQSFSGGNVSTFPEQSRPDSRASVRSESFSSHMQQQPSTQSFQQESIQQEVDAYYNEDGQPRKRAKVVQADWRGKSSFGSRSADLRVTAAKTSSMQMFRPIAKRPSAPGTNLEPPPRVPTPVPQRTRPIQPRMPSAVARSSLRQASTADSDMISDADLMSDIMTSPEGSSPGNSLNGEGTPMDIPSSPPIVPGYNHPQPSSPGLPTLSSHMADSGYMSGGFRSGTVMESLEDEADCSPDAEDLDVAARYQPRNRYQQPLVKSEGSPIDGTPAPYSDMQFSSDMPDMDLPDTDNRPGHLSLPNNPSHRQLAPRPASAMSPPDDDFPQSRRGSLALPTKAPAKQKRQPLKRTRTSNDSEAGSPAPSDNEGQPKPYRSGSSAPRRQIIEKRLQESISKGIMPQFCSHCGSIETPTWRKLYVRTMDGKPGPLDSVAGEGETVGVEVTERNSAGESTKFLIRKTMKKTKDMQPGKGFEDTVVCNPCGLWFNKFQNMRPPEKWARKSATRKTRKKADDATDGAEPPSEAYYSEQVMPEETIVAGPLRTLAPAPPSMSQPTQSSELGPTRPRANSTQDQPRRPVSQDGNMRRPHRDPEYMRAIQSSPVRSQGSEASPIELDLTPNPTRRLIFPSPRRDGESKSLEDGKDGSRPKSASPSEDVTVGKLRATANKVTICGETNVNVYETFAYDKENRAPPLDEDDDLSHLFEGSPGAMFKTPSRKTPAKRNITPLSQKQTQSNELLKTPTQNSRKRKPLTPSANAANNADMNTNDFMCSPSSTRYFLRSTPSRLERTPGGRTVSGGSNSGSNDVSPFSRHLAQMLSDADNMGNVPFTSPSRQFDFSDLPTFTTPGREVDWKGLDEIMSSDFASYDDNGMAFSTDLPNGGGHA
ncbi:Putative Zinc finger, NHR/GATA-type [Septoria linicola]|uniref:Zinc finger, NHR/GATA-type n=1 Tax=Septoria linicola TaxID=215465 RepID=A0A9Q9EF22_9PEZI|nr:putative Zinc finger, NHR/GATA-type [Septoria linicola]USW49366.1 Putative Zinc finger, NHR/GATA-type [Septoria linicola]